MKRTCTRIEPLCKDGVNDVAYLRATLDTRYQSETMPLVITVAYNKRTYYLPTGYKFTLEGFEKVKNARGGAGDFIAARRETRKYYDRVLEKTRQLISDGSFTFQNLKEALGMVVNAEVKTLQDHWRDIADSKEKRKTKEMYYSSMRSFYRYIGCKVTFTDTDSEEFTNTGKFTIKGRRADIDPKEVTDTMIKGWGKSLSDDGKSAATVAVYMRALRAVLYQLRDNEKVLKEAPRMQIKAGGRRKEDYLKVTDILRIRDYEGEAKEAADWWIMLYLCNGCNMVDLAQLMWNNDYFNNNELSFVRSKTEGKAPVKVFIPVTDYLRPYLEKYGSKPEFGKRVFPQILKDGEHTDTQITNTAHRYNMIVRKGMATVCEALEIRQDKAITASTARNSYITTLTWHQVSDAFIDSMVGHADGNKVLRGYQGTISPKMRARFNNLLFTNPEGEDD